MKKVIFGTALASMALLSACSSDNELANVETSANNAIGFHVVGNKAETRATPITPDNLTKTDFNVYAYINNADDTDGAPFMGGNDTEHGTNGINISHNGKVWGYTNDKDLRYWPTTALNFYAVSPASTGMFSWQFSNTKKEISYTCHDEYQTKNFYVDDDGTKKQHLTNPDAMYAVDKGQTYTKENSGIVKFTFKHILSQVIFKAKTQYDNNMEVDVNAVSIHNFKEGGTFNIPEGEPEQVNWTPRSINLAPVDGFTVKKVEENKNITVTTSKNAVEISDGPMLFVPQKLTKWNVAKTIDEAKTAEQSYLKITCKIKQGGAYLFGNVSEYKDLYVPFEADWQPGKRYIYTLIFGGGYDKDGHSILKPINFDAEVEAWDENTTNNSDININK